MTESDAKDSGLWLADHCDIAMLGTVDEKGVPAIKAMLKMENEGLKTIWLTTNSSSRRVARLREDARACIYFVDDREFKGLMLQGTVEILQDPESRRRVWRQGFEIYYPKGIEDPDYSVLRFTANRGNYYHQLENRDFDL
jgi:general stress protein 26